MIFSFLYVRSPSSDILSPTIFWLLPIEPHRCVYNIYHRGTGRKEDTIFFRMPDAMQEISIVVVSVSVYCNSDGGVRNGASQRTHLLSHLLIFVSPYSPPQTFIFGTFIQIQPTKPPFFSCSALPNIDFHPLPATISPGRSYFLGSLFLPHPLPNLIPSCFVILSFFL